MPIKTSLRTDHQLDQLAAQFEHWRQTRSHSSERIPQPLWDQAAVLAKDLPHTRVAKHLRLSPNDLKKHMLAQQQPTFQACAPTVNFVEVPPPPVSPASAHGTEIELQRADGARLCLRSSDSTLALAALVRAFLEAH